MKQAYIVELMQPYGKSEGWPKEIPLRVAVLAGTRAEALAMAADALEFIIESNAVEIRGLTVEAVYPIVGGVVESVSVHTNTQVDGKSLKDLITERAAEIARDVASA